MCVRTASSSFKTESEPLHPPPLALPRGGQLNLHGPQALCEQAVAHGPSVRRPGSSGKLDIFRVSVVHGFSLPASFLSHGL